MADQQMLRSLVRNALNYRPTSETTAQQEADRFSLEDKRTTLLPESKIGAVQAEALADDEHAEAGV